MNKVEFVLGALDAVQDAVLLCDEAGAVVHANDAARTLFAGAIPRSRQELLTHPSAVEARESRLQHGLVLVVPRQPGGGTLAERERQDIERALIETGWRLVEAAKRLGISRTTLWRRLRDYRLSRPPGPASTASG